MSKKPSLETENRTLRRKVRELEAACKRLYAENKKLTDGWATSSEQALGLRVELQEWRERFDTLLQLKASGKDTP